MRRITQQALSLLGSISLALSAHGIAQAAQDSVKVGMMLPYSGTYADLGNNIDQGFQLYIDEQGGTLDGVKIEYVRLDDESNPSKGPENANRLVNRDKVDVMVGTVHSGVAMAMAKVANDTDTLLIIPNAGAMAITGPLCSNNIFRSSFSNWQPGYAMGKVAADKFGHKTAVTVTWKYAAGDESVQGFTEGFEEGGGKVVRNLTVPFPDVEFQALLTEIASLKPDAVYTFFAGGGAVKFVLDYAAAGLKDNISLYGAGFITDGTLQAQGKAAEGLYTTLHYADDLDLAKDKSFREAYEKKFNRAPDVYSVQGYDAAQMLHAGLKEAKGDFSNRDAVVKGMSSATYDSPRGKLTLSPSHNPVHDLYLRKVENGINAYQGVAVAQLGDPARGCRLK
ncbi:MAG: ABC transporter substrate-binding protein [Pigmentiphaga sp.]|nr:ABC transporter substrate-binding protein [Pigmentiphaga sp.]